MVKRRGDGSFPFRMAALRADYNAAKNSEFRRRRTGVASMGSGADFHYRNESEWLRMIELARDFDRNDQVVGQGVTRAVDNHIQDGISLDPDTGDDGLDREWSARWKSWGEDPDQCDLSGELTWSQMEHLVPRQMLVDGDVFALPTTEGSLELVEAHRCRTPNRTTRNVVHGVLIDERRKRLEYWFTRDDVDPNRAVNLVRDVRRVAARDPQGRRQVFHVRRWQRISQTRGITAFAPIVDPVGMHDDIQFAKLVQQQACSSFAVFRRRELGFAAEGDKQYGEREIQTRGDGSKRFLEGIGPGMEIPGEPGETLEGFSPNIPNPEWFQHARLILTFIAINFGIPLQVFLLDASETNFSGWRGALDQAKIGFRRNQHQTITGFHRPVYRWKVGQWLADDPAVRTVASRSGVDPFRHKWKPAGWPYIEPLKDAKADEIRLEKGLTSRRRYHSERGADFDEIRVEIVADNKAQIREAVIAKQELTEEFPDEEFHWTHFLALPKAKAVSGGGVDDQDAPDADTERELEDEDRSQQPPEGAASGSVLRPVGS